MPFSPRRWSARRSLIAALTAAGTALTAMALAGPAQASTTPQYKIVLSTAANTEYFGINANGDIFGVTPQNGFVHPALFRAGSAGPVFLGPPASQSADNMFLADSGLNNADQVVGQDSLRGTALLWPNSATPANLSQVPGLTGTFRDTNAAAISNKGVIVGDGVVGNSSAEIPFSITNNVATRLPVLPDGGFDGQPVAVNDSGVIVGLADTATEDPQAVEWVNGAIKRFPNLPNTFLSRALAVNASGEAVGNALVTGDTNQHAVLWANGKAADINFGNGDASANAINASGVIVGDGPAGVGQGADSNAFIYKNGVATNLNTLIPAGSGVLLVTARGINDQGDIVGSAFANGGEFGYELVPVSS